MLKPLFCLAVSLCLAFLASSPIAAQSVCLPAPRLLTTMPMGGQVGSEVTVTISGQDLDDADQLRFSHPGITATPQRDADGKPVANQYVVKISPDCPAGVHEARVMTRLGISSSRAFSVGQLPESVRAKPATSLADAVPLELNSVCNAVMSVRSVDHYTFEAEQGQRLGIDCAAQGIDSKLKPVLIVADAEGQDLVVERRGGAIDYRVPESGKYTIKVHDLTFQGGAHHFYRLSIETLAPDALLDRLPTTRSVNAFSWPPAGVAGPAETQEVEPNAAQTAQRVTLPCDVSGSFFPAADVDVYEFDAKQGEVWWVEVASERLGRPTDPSILVQHVSQVDGEEVSVDVAELNDIASPVKVSSNGYSYDGPPYNAGSADVLGKLEIKQDGLHRLQLSDLFGGTRSDPANVYRLIIRRAQPDFAVVAWALHMNLRNGDRNALSKPMALRRGTTMPLEVVVIRRDGFAGPIDLVMDNLPDGVTAQGLQIPAGKSRGIMLLTAHETAPRGLTSAKFTASAQIDGVRMERRCHLASMAWPVPNAWSEIPAPRLLADVPVSVGGAELAPLTIKPREEQALVATAGQKLTIPLLHLRRSEFSGATLSLKAFGAGFESMPAFEISLNEDHSEAVLDLAKLKTPPGRHVVAFYGSAVAKYSHRPDLVALAEQALAEATGKAAAADATPQMKSAVAEARKQLEAAKKRAQPKDIVDIVVSQPIAIEVQAAEKT